MSNINALVKLYLEEEEKKSKVPLIAGIGTALAVHHMLGGNPDANAGFFRKMAGSASAITGTVAGMKLHKMLSKRNDDSKNKSAEQVNDITHQSL